MRLGLACAVLALLAGVGGCLHTSDADQRAKAEQSNEAAVKAAAEQSGKQAQYEAAKKREQEYLSHGSDDQNSKQGQ